MNAAATTRLAASEWLLDTAPYAIIAVDSQQTIVLANRAAERLFHYEAGQLLGQPLSVLIPEPLRDEHQLSVSEYLAQPEPRVMGSGRDLSGRRRDGSSVRVEVALSPAQTHDGPITLASIIDVTERREREDELRRSNRDLEQFAYIASHDLKEPLRMVSGFMGLLNQKYGDQLDDNARRYIHFAIDGAARMQRLIEGLLQFSRLSTRRIRLAPVDTTRVLQEALINLTGPIKDTNALITSSDLPVVLGDSGLLVQLFQNIIDNAIKFRSERQPHIRLDATHNDDRSVTLSFQDNGIGFDATQRERIFEMFGRLHGAGEYEGSGMGLTISKRIAELHGGTITVEATPGTGSCFHVTLLLARTERGAENASGT